MSDSTPGAVQFHWRKKPDNHYLPSAGNPYYLFGSLALLDTPGEWYMDAGANTLYLWPPRNDAPASHLVEAKRRDLAFDLSGKSYITLQGLSFFACAVSSSATSKYLTLDSLSCRYLSHYAYSEAATGSGFDPHMEDSGLILNGSHHTLRNSHLAFSAGNAVTLLGDHHLVENCTIHDVDYLEVDCAAINTGTAASVSSDHEIRYNTCYNSGRGLLLLRSLIRGLVHHNDLGRSMLRTTDGGAIYTFSHDGQNTEIAYNRIHDHVAPDNGAAGIYLDGGVSNYRVHHNLVYNTWNALEYNLACVNILWYNNTSIAFNKSFFGGVSGSQSGTELRNHILTAPIVTYAGLTQSNNTVSTEDPQFVSPAGLDFRIQSTSPAHDTGAALPPYTDGYEGVAPDRGALEYGQTPWQAGSPIDTGLPAGPTNLTAAGAGATLQLAWQNHSVNETSLVVERSTDNRSYTVAATLPPATTSYVERTVRRGVPYYYRVRADESAFTNYVLAAIPGHDAYAPIEAETFDTQSGVVTGSGSTGTVIGSCDNNDWVKYTAVDFGTGANQISLFAASGTNATNNRVEVRLGSTTGTLIATIAVLSTGGYSTYTTLSSGIATLTGVQDLVFVFKGGAGVCNLDYFSFAIASPIPPPTAVSSVAAAARSATQMQVSWTPPGGSEDGFKVERSTDDQSFQEVGVVAAGIGTFTNSGLSAATTYYYRVRSFNNQGYTAYTPIVAATTLTLLEAWRGVYFGSTANSGDGADSADPDQDGVTNLAEYAFGLHLKRGDSLRLPQGQRVGSNFVVSFTQPAGVSGVIYGAEWSTSLATGSWTPVADTGAGMAHIFSVPITGETSAFVRLLVSGF